MSKILIGIDAGFVSTGISVFEVGKGGCKFLEAKCIKTEKSSKKRGLRVADDDSERIRVIVAGIDEIYSKYASSNDIFIAVEIPTGGAQGARANRTMGIITGAIVAFITLRNVPVEYITPNEVKLAVTGRRNASKEEIMNKIRLMLDNHKENLPKSKAEFEHIADSVGVVLHVRKNSQMYKMFVNKG